jgi:hypothetical protein
MCYCNTQSASTALYIQNFCDGHINGRL